jgi:hypothetical protein
MQYHPEYDTERPWFEHTETGLTSNGRQHCPYANPDAGEMHLATPPLQCRSQGQ